MKRAKWVKYLTILLLLVFIAFSNGGNVNTSSTIFSLEHDNLNKDLGKESPALGIYNIPTWWNDSWHFRLYLNITFNYDDINDTSVRLVVNFTQYLETLSAGNKTVDPNSIRVIEYDASTNTHREVPSRFIKYSGWDPTTNATGVIIFVVPAPIESGVVRTFHIYFDTTYYGLKNPPNYARSFEGYWEQFYEVYSGDYHYADDVAFTEPKYLERNYTKIYYSDNPSYPGDPFPPEISSTDTFGGNWTTWLHISSSGNYQFRLYSDDGSWLFIDDNEVINNGGLHAPRSVSATVYLEEGVHKLMVKWYENYGTAQINLYWTPPGASESLLTTNIYGFKYTKLMSYSNPPTMNIWKVESSYTIELKVVDKSNKPVESTQVLLYNITNGANNLIFSTTTNNDGIAIISATTYGDYLVVIRNETNYPQGFTNKVWVSTNFTFSYTSTTTEKYVKKVEVLPLATVDILVIDKNGNPMKRTSDEITYVMLYNESKVRFTTNYLTTNASGYVRYYRLPVGTYILGFNYTTYIYYQSYDENIMGNAKINVLTSGVITVTIGLTNVNVRIVSRDGQPIPSATVTIDYPDVKNPYIPSVTNTTMENGIASFYRVLNDTWNIYVSYTNLYGQKVYNNSVSYNFQSDTPIDISLNVTELRVLVLDAASPNPPIPGSNVTIYEYDNVSLTMSSSTDINGYAVFTFIKSGNYNITANYQGNIASTNSSFQSKTNVTLKITIIRRTGDSYLTPLNDTYIVATWNDNFTIIVNYTWWDGSKIQLVTNPDSVNFTVYLLSSEIFKGTIDNGFVKNNGDGTYTIQINTTVLGMYPSQASYSIVIKAHNETQNDPTPLMFIVTVNEASTSIDITPVSITLNWTESFSLNVTYYDETHDNLIITDANVTYVIINETHHIITYGQFSPLNQSYYACLSTEDYNIIPGEYNILIYIGKKGYENKTLAVPLYVFKTKTSIQLVTAELINVTWGELVTIKVQYLNLLNKSIIQDASVNILLNGTYKYDMLFNMSSNLYEIIFNSSELPAGYYEIIISASRIYFEEAVRTMSLEVMPVQIEYVLVNVSSTYNITWGNSIDILFYIKTKQTSMNITNAVVKIVWSPIKYEIMVNYNLSLGMYYSNINTTNLSEGTYNMTIVTELQNYTTISYTVKVIVNPVPTIIISESESIEIVWGDYLPIRICYYDTYYNRGIKNATVYAIIAGITQELLYTGNNGTYEYNMLSTSLSPGVYNLTVFAIRSNYMMAVKTILVTILVPVDLQSNNIEGYWGTTIPIVVNATNLINGSPIVGAIITVKVGELNLTLSDIGKNGTYFGTIDLSKFKAGEIYQINISFSKELCESKFITTYILRVNPAPTNLLLISKEPEDINIEEGTKNITLIVQFINNLTSSTISNASIKVLWTNQTYEISNLTYIVEEVTAGSYKITIDVSNLPVGGPYVIRVSAEKGNYTTSELQYTFNIIEQRIKIPGTNIAIPRSIIITGVGGSALSAALLGLALYGYRIYKIPWIIRATDKAIKALIKGKPVDFSKFPDLMALIEENIAPLFKGVRHPPLPERQRL